MRKRRFPFPLVAIAAIHLYALTTLGTLVERMEIATFPT